MYIKRYSVASLILIGAIGWFVFAFVSQEHIHITVMGITLPSLPIAAWVVISLVIFYLATISHMMYYSIIGSLRLRKYQKDFMHMKEALADALLGVKPRKNAFRSDRYALLGRLIDSSTIVPDEKLSHIGDDTIDDVIQIIQQINDGDVVELRKFHLSPDNALVVKNNINRYVKGQLSDENVLDKQSIYGEELCAQAYTHYVATVPIYAIDKYKSFMTRESLNVILKRVNAEKNKLDVANEDLINYTKQLDLNADDFIDISKTLSHAMNPEKRMKLFEMLSETNDEAMSGYLYTLFDLEMLEPANEILDSSQPNEFIRFKAYSTLKSYSKNYDIKLFIS